VENTFELTKELFFQ